MKKRKTRAEIFSEEYLIDLNATQAAIRAGYSPHTAEQQGYQLLQKPSVSGYISKKMAERSKRTGISADRVLRELARIAFVDPSKLVDFNSASVMQGVTQDDLACVQAVKVKRGKSNEGSWEEREVKLYDKIKSLELVGRHLGMWNDKLDVTGAMTIIVEDEYADDDAR